MLSIALSFVLFLFTFICFYVILNFFSIFIYFIFNINLFILIGG